METSYNSQELFAEYQYSDIIQADVDGLELVTARG